MPNSPSRVRQRGLRLALLSGLLLFFIFSWRMSGVDPLALFSVRALSALGRNIGAMFPPKLDPEFLASLGWPIIETVAIALVGLSGALLIAVPLTYFAVPARVLRSPEDGPLRPVSRVLEHALHYGTRSVLAIFRTVPELIWALMFVHAVGLGMVPGVLAIVFSYGGVIGKVFAEIIEGVNQAPLDALRATGAGRFRVFVFGVLPQAFPLILSYSLYRFDCAIRSSAVLGLVGAGGVGLQIELSIKMMEYGEVLSEILVLLILVALSDLLSAAIRRRVSEPGTKTRFDGSSLAPASVGLERVRRAAAARGRRGTLVAVASYIGLVLLVAHFVGLGPRILIDALGGFGSFFIRAFPPETAPDALARYVRGAGETLGISFLGTMLALVLAWPLAVLGARRALVSDEHLRSRSRRLERNVWWIASAGARLVLNLMRTIPMVMFALIFVPAIGIGPFAGVLAIALHTAGVFGRLYMEMIDEVSPGTLETFRNVGARKLQVMTFVILPQTLRQIFAFFFYRWEVNLRESIILGIVGGGGIGQLIYMSISLFHEHETYSLIIVLLVLVIAVDIVSSRLRRWVLERHGERREVREVGAEAQLGA